MSTTAQKPASLQADPERRRPLVTSGRATPAMLRAAPRRAAPETTRALQQSGVLDLGATPFTKGLLETGRVTRSGSQRRRQTARWTPKPDFLPIFTEEGGDAAVCRLWPGSGGGFHVRWIRLRRP